MAARMLVEPGTKKSRTETWAGINGVGEVVLLSVAIVRAGLMGTSRARALLQSSLEYLTFASGREKPGDDRCNGDGVLHGKGGFFIPASW
jgi:hypothetical protein